MYSNVLWIWKRIFMFWPQPTHTAARSLYDSWATCLSLYQQRRLITSRREFTIMVVFVQSSLGQWRTHVVWSSQQTNVAVYRGFAWLVTYRGRLTVCSLNARVRQGTAPVRERERERETRPMSLDCPAVTISASLNLISCRWEDSETNLRIGVYDCRNDKPVPVTY